jgi:hypothetical protein
MAQPERADSSAVIAPKKQAIRRRDRVTKTARPVELHVRETLPTVDSAIVSTAERNGTAKKTSATATRFRLIWLRD